ncbi:MAG: PEP/pyruvate-binding domain-containing protein [Verrucomicrobiia bacterium]
MEASTNLVDWTAIGTAHGGLDAYPDPASDLLENRFYRVSMTPMTKTDDWKNQVRLPEDPFLSGYGEAIGPDFQWIKFAIPFAEPFRVYYQDSKKYDFHYDFATNRLAPFRGLTPVQFDQVALRTNGQQVLLGTLLLPPEPNAVEYGIQFVGQDPFPSSMISDYFELVKATVSGAGGLRAFYVPTYEQSRQAEADKAYFEARGIALASPDRWIVGDDVYSMGWALGRVKDFPGTEIADAFRDGRLEPGDILLTDGVPAEVPVLAGLLSLTPSTPNSHVAILAKTFGLPFAFLSDPALRERVQGMVGKDVVLRLDPYSFDIKVIELEASLPAELRAEILSLKAPPKLEIVPKVRYGKISASTDALTPADIQYFGGKASNFGFLRREIPDRSPPAIAFSFDLWDAFLGQMLAGGKTLRAEIESRLSRHSYPPNMGDLQAHLAEIRDLITDIAQFTPEQKAAILDAVSVFDPVRKIRFRSSTNVEDSEQFTGAGLYDSFSGCAADDLDNDQNGPSLCDPTESRERGVFRAIQKVYASFYNLNAVVERLRHRLDEDTVGMALLVHHSAPDETELANGVATVQVQRGDYASTDAELVTQKGAVSVTNPDGTARPEVVQGYRHGYGVGKFLRQRSSLVPLGAWVLDPDKDYTELMNLLAKVGDAYHAYFPAKSNFTLDFEYKKLVPGVLSVKQVREIPKNDPAKDLPDFLVHQTNTYWVLQGEAGDVFANHRLKSFWSFHARNMKLVPTNLVDSVYRHIEGTYLDDGKPTGISGAPAELPNASHSVNGDVMIDRWLAGSGDDRRDFELRTEIRRGFSPDESPVLTLADFGLQLSVTYATPQPALEYDFETGLKPVTVTNESVVLEPRRTLTSTNLLQQRSHSAGGVKVQTEFYWPKPPSRGIGEKTAPLVEWKETRIEGLTPEPIVLKGFYSQTYRPGHHNFSEEFIFEPALEEGLSADVLSALQAANVKFILLTTGFMDNSLMILGLDGKFRTLENDGAGKPKLP